MALELPEEVPTDTAYAGSLTISLPIIAALLRLPEGKQVVGASINLRGEVELKVVGKGLPPIGSDGQSQRVNIQCSQETRGGYPVQRRTICWCEHDPDHTWVQSDWSSLP